MIYDMALFSEWLDLETNTLRPDAPQSAKDAYKKYIALEERQRELQWRKLTEELLSNARDEALTIDKMAILGSVPFDLKDMVESIIDRYLEEAGKVRQVRRAV